MSFNTVQTASASPLAVGIIAEYNPFHNGHLYQLNEAKRLSGAEFLVVVMSGSFVQRGVPAFLSKTSRTRMALENGADLVLELPVRYATGSAEYFSLGAVSLLENIGVIDCLCFGSESGATSEMKIIADLIQKNCDDFNNSIGKHLKSGLSYPAAREKTLINHCDSLSQVQIKELISSPNNILGIEYLKALSLLKSSIKPFTIKRKQTGYHDPSLSVENSKECAIHSASAIRASLEKNFFLPNIKQSVPESVYQILNNEKGYPVTSKMLSDMLYYAIASSTIEELASYQDVTYDLARTIKKSLNQFKDYEQFISVLKSKQFTYTRISRSLLHILLKMPAYSLKGLSSEEIAPYARILGFRRCASRLLKEIKQNCTIPMITKMADAKNMLSTASYEMLSQDVFSTSLYQRLVFQSFHQKEKNDIQTSPVIL
ncbi:nucleotidyltransferase [[Clostridium] polysaccharolyticum]|uniref:tRNA(Met) cytidine acetate ligase n=1 Tax=[Clostridium] polysaccharolyticum TaxID=29364 RepID=A0A1I0AZM1_9FIRM|nr:nucleotidyltransferase [[Clostridium] polysaccharolyticum]SES99911.1 Predicted nucleotidyltransferase [[Clostridium] polysaccharolyticum]